MNGILAELGYPQIALIIIHNTDSESAIRRIVQYRQQQHGYRHENKLHS